MHLRCATCHGTIWVETRDDAPPKSISACTACGQTYKLSPKILPGASGEQLYTHARRFAQEQGIDMPGSFSVLLGVMTLDQVRDTSRSASNRHTGSKDPDREVNAPRFDRSFADAVDAGLLTPKQALQRGKRDTYAAGLVARHRLSQDAAYAVADNRITVLAAVRQRGSSDPIVIAASGTKGGGSSGIRVAAIAAVAVALIGVLGFRSLQEDRTVEAPTLASLDVRIPTQAVTTIPHSVQGALEAATEVLTDTEDHPTRITGPDPRIVLDVFCRSYPDRGLLRPLRVVPSVPASPEKRWGLFQDVSEPQTVRALPMRRDRRTRQWIAGDGAGPIPHRIVEENG